MKKILLFASAVVLMTACKKSEEIKVDQTKVETQGDTIVEKDTVAYNEIAPIEMGKELAQTGQTNGYTVFGKKFTPSNVLSSAQMIKKYKSLKTGDTVVVQFKSKVKEVCKKKGCWMSLVLPGEKESFVRFKDYAFFVPKNADGSQAIVHGKAYLDIVSVAELQHYAKDGGKSAEDIAKIKDPKITYAFQADGVLMK
jgi:hypothetical protein